MTVAPMRRRLYELVTRWLRKERTIGATLAPRFSEDIRGRLADVAKDLDEWEEYLKQYEAAFQDRFEPEHDPTDPALSTRDKVTLTTLSAVAYTRQLAWAIVRAINAESTPSLYLTTRAHFEMTGFLAYLLWRLRQFDTGTLPEIDFDEYLTRLHLGRRHGAATLPADIAKSTKWINVLEMIDAVDRVTNEPELKGLFRDAYEWLSEFCHPNSFSRFSVQRLVGRTMHYAQSPRITPNDAGLGIGHASISHIIFFAAHKEISEWIDRPR